MIPPNADDVKHIPVTDDNNIAPANYTGDECGSDGDGWICTRETSHDGPHVAHGEGGQILAQWEDA